MSDNTNLRIALIGCGKIAQTHAAALKALDEADFAWADITDSNFIDLPAGAGPTVRTSVVTPPEVPISSAFLVSSTGRVTANTTVAASS